MRSRQKHERNIPRDCNERTPALREQGNRRELLANILMDTAATELAFFDDVFDFACESGGLNRNVAEMLYVARKIASHSDCRNFGQGSKLDKPGARPVETVAISRLHKNESQGLRDQRKGQLRL